MLLEKKTTREAGFYIVLYRRLKGDRVEYVTWLQNTRDGGMYHGHYFDNLEDALADFMKRDY